MAAKTAPKLVGLDIGTSGIRAVEVAWKRRQNAFVITKAASVELPRGAVRNGAVVDQRQVAKALKKLWRKGHFHTRKVAIGLADSSILTRQVDLPWMPPADFRAALRYQVADALPVDLGTVQIDYHLLDERPSVDSHGQQIDANRILVVAANTEAVTVEAAAVRKARLQPVRADSSAFALIRAVCRGVVPDDTSMLAIADLGADQLTVVVHQGGQPRFIRTISNLGGESATLSLAEKLDIAPDDAEALKRGTGLNGPAPIIAPIAESTVFGGVTAPEMVPMDLQVATTVAVLNPWATTLIAEIRNSLDYFQATDPTTPIQSLTITGRTSELDGMVDRLSTQLPIPVHRLDPLLGLGASRRVTKQLERDTRLAVATGLAMGVAP
ncbi:MAG: type IV pilus assembly protein PilM [Actinobacteria bacterium]|jgi:type IV pilus assembly protein PilM|nr:type IV pilus assembly protein PilM [Actinomycetota bacterium]